MRPEEEAKKTTISIIVHLEDGSSVQRSLFWFGDKPITAELESTIRMSFGLPENQRFLLLDRSGENVFALGASMIPNNTQFLLRVVPNSEQESLRVLEVNLPITMPEGLPIEIVHKEDGLSRELSTDSEKSNSEKSLEDEENSFKSTVLTPPESVNLKESSNRGPESISTSDQISCDQTLNEEINTIHSSPLSEVEKMMSEKPSNVESFATNAHEGSSSPAFVTSRASENFPLELSSNNSEQSLNPLKRKSTTSIVRGDSKNVSKKIVHQPNGSADHLQGEILHEGSIGWLSELYYHKWTLVSVGGQIPQPRWGQQTAFLPGISKIFMVGGSSDRVAFNQAFLFDLKSRMWTSMDNFHSSHQCNRTWATLTFVPSKNILWLFGGEDHSEKSMSSSVVMDLQSFEWSTPTLKGVEPSPRGGHSASIVGNLIILFGGHCANVFSSDMPIIDVDKMEVMYKTIRGEIPFPRSFHTATVIGTKVVVIGGNDATQCFNTVHVLETTTWFWKKVECGGVNFVGLTGHSAILLDETRILILGGWTSSSFNSGAKKCQFYLNSLILDTSDWCWSYAHPGYSIPRIGNSMVAVDMNADPSDRLICSIGGLSPTSLLADVNLFRLKRK